MTSCPDSVKKLVERFNQQSDTVCLPSYNETNLRVDYINPFMEAIGWDINNSKGYAEQYREVIHEDRVKVSGQTKAPDYSFRIGGQRKFFLEAKKPAVNIKKNKEPAYQLRRYAWSAKLACSILTDFEEFAIYDTRKRPKQFDTAAVARREYIHYTEYEERWDFIYGTFSREAVLKAAAHVLECAPEDLVAHGGRVEIAGTDRSMTFREVARAVYSEMGRLPYDVREELEATESYDPFVGTTSSACHIATVEIDPETYEVRLGRYVVAEDCGRVINPAIVDGQVHGGVAQGIGAALYEEVVYDEEGQILTASLVDYLVPAAGEIPPMDVTHVEAALPPTIGGYRGMGEGGTIGAPAAVANAVADALAPLGVEVAELPITPERLFRLIEGAAAKE